MASWQFLAGPTQSDLHLVGSARRSDFETAAGVASPGPSFEVRALDAHGRVIGTSAVVSRA